MKKVIITTALIAAFAIPTAALAQLTCYQTSWGTTESSSQALILQITKLSVPTHPLGPENFVTVNSKRMVVKDCIAAGITYVRPQIQIRCVGAGDVSGEPDVDKVTLSRFGLIDMIKPRCTNALGICHMPVLAIAEYELVLAFPIAISTQLKNKPSPRLSMFH
jgi:hypothetical protein